MILPPLDLGSRLASFGSISSMDARLLVALDWALLVTILCAFDVPMTLSTSFLPNFTGHGSSVNSIYLILYPC